MVMETLPSGTILHGRYRIERVLGSGGFGHVYLAVDLHANAQYAIKEYLVTGPSGKAQLEHEEQVLSHCIIQTFQLSSPRSMSGDLTMGCLVILRAVTWPTTSASDASV